MMSGIEIMGLVLASIPLLISGLKHYAKGVITIQRWFRYEKELRKLVRALRPEHIRILGTCELLLHGLVSGQDMRNLIQQPHSSRWKEQSLDQKLRK